MHRRGFLSRLLGGVAVAAVVAREQQTDPDPIAPPEPSSRGQVRWFNPGDSPVYVSAGGHHREIPAKGYLVIR